MIRRPRIRQSLPLASTLLALVISLHPAFAAGRAWMLTPIPNPGTARTNGLFGVTSLSPTLAWAVGLYHPTSTTEHVLIERWNGSTWTQVPGANPSSHSFLVSVAASSPTDVWATGAYLGTDSILHALVEHFDGVSWSAIPVPDVPGQNFNDLTGVAVVSPHDVFAVGNYRTFSSFGQTPPPTPYPLAEHWNGSTWTQVPTPSAANGGYLYRVSASGGTIMAAGWLGGSNGDYHPLVARWNGSAFVPTAVADAGPASELNGIDVLSPQDAWAVGDSYDAHGNDLPLTEHWNGSSWSTVPSPTVPNSSQPAYAFFDDVSGITSSDVWAAGGYVTSGNVEQTLTEHWNGSSWTIISSPNSGSGDNYFNGIAAVVLQGRVIEPSEALAVGSTYLDPYDSTSQPLAACYC